jgi:hypothetical protein
MTSLVMGGFGCGTEESADEAGYYLNGRVLDGATLEPVSKASLTLVAGDDKVKVTSDEAGSYRIGPIPARSAYRLDVAQDSFEAFQFQGLALSPLDEGEDSRTLTGDVLLYPAGKKSPAFKVMIGTSDSGSVLDPAIDEVRFTPVTEGYDPSLTGTLGPDVASTNVIGAYREPGGTTLVNHARAGMQGYRVDIANGVAEVPEGALRWGGTYLVDIDGGSSFTPARFLITAVHGDEVQVSLQKTAAASGNGAGGAVAGNDQQYFTGRVYDGVSLGRLTDFAIRLEYFDRVIEGTVDANGRYVVGPLLPNADYSIVIEAAGFRSFLSHNKRFASGAAAAPQTSFYYDAFLYPEGLATPAVKCRFRLDGSTDLPSGIVRLAPRSSSTLFDEDDETPAGVDRQVWQNDDDLQQRAVVKELADGEALFEAGELTFGVSYAVTLYGAGDYVLADNVAFRAGIDAEPVWVLQPSAITGLAVVAISSESLPLSPDASVTIRFNQPIAISPRAAESTMLKAINDGFSISSPDKDMDATTNTLVTTGELANYRGVNYAISGDTLQLTWARGGALLTTDAEDPINSVTYAGLNQLRIYPTNAAQPTDSSLGSLVGSDSIVVAVTAQ